MATINEVYRPTRQVAAGGVCGVRARVARSRASWLVVVVGGLLLAVTVTAAAEVMFALVHSPLRVLPVEEAAGYGHMARWSDPSPRVASGVLAAVGLMLIALPLLPGRARDRAPRTGAAVPHGHTALTPRVTTLRDGVKHRFAPSESASVPTVLH